MAHGWEEVNWNRLIDIVWMARWGIIIWMLGCSTRSASTRIQFDVQLLFVGADVELEYCRRLLETSIQDTSFDLKLRGIYHLELPWTNLICSNTFKENILLH